MSTISAGTTLTTALVQTGDTTGELVIKTDNGNTTAATFTTAGNLGIGTSSPSNPLTINKGNDDGIRIRTADSNYSALNLGVSTGNIAYIQSQGYGSGTVLPLAFYTGGSERMRLDSSGNLGLGVTPSAWGGNFVISQYKGGSIGSQSSSYLYTAQNGYYDGSNWKYVASNYATLAEQSGGSHKWYTAPSGTAENAITFTQAMTLDASGNLGIGTTSPQARFHISSSSAEAVVGRFQSSGSTAAYIGFAGSGAATTYDVACGAAGTNIFAIKTSDTERMRIDSSGNVGIGTSSPGTKLNVTGGSIRNANTNGILEFANGNTAGGAKIAAYNAALNANGYLAFEGYSIEYGRFSATGGFSVGTTADPGVGAIYATGNITAYYSDDRLKTKLGGIENALDKVKALSGFYYEANQTAQDLGYQAVREVGVSAQQVQAVMPEVVKPAPIDQQYLTVDYERLVPLLIEAIKELEEKVAKLEAK